MGADPREALGREVRAEWVRWARQQPGAKPSWLLPWAKLDDAQREVDMRIGEAVQRAAVRQAARQILLLDAEPSPKGAPYYDMRTSLRRLARGEPLPDLPHESTEEGRG